MSDEPDSKDSVLYDGDCPMCRAFVARLDQTDKPDSLRFDNFRDRGLPQGIQPEAAEIAMHFIDEHGHVYRGAEAVLHTLQKYPKYAWLGRFGLLPGVRVLANLAYPVIARNRFLLFGPYQTLYLTKLLLSLGFLIPMFIASKLWLGDSFRLFPLAPIASWLPAISYPIDVVIYVLLMGLLTAIFFLPNARLILVTFLVSGLLYSLWDQNRWQPYNYLFAAMLLVLATVPWARRPSPEWAIHGVPQTRRLLGLLTASVWFWSGLQKCNGIYMTVGAPWLLEPLGKHLPQWGQTALGWLGAGGPLLEIAGALLLLSRRFRRAGVVLLTLMHLFVLLAIGPLGRNINFTVWPWNAVMVLFCWLLFWPDRDSRAADYLAPCNLLHGLLGVLFGVMPIFNFFGSWDDYLSHSLYSWRTLQAEVVFSAPPVFEAMPGVIRASARAQDNTEILHLNSWAYLELESPVFPSERVFRRVLQRVCELSQNSPSVSLRVFSRPQFFGSKRMTTTFTCQDVI